MTDEEALARWCCGNQDAIAMIQALFQASHDADDIVDGDAESPVKAMAQCWLGLVGGVMCSPYLDAPARRYAICEVIKVGIPDWWLSTEWESSEDDVRGIYAYVLRETLEHVIVAVAYAEGGAEWAMQVRREVSERFHIDPPNREEFHAWRAEVRRQHGLAA